jgi:hypothetical protein
MKTNVTLSSQSRDLFGITIRQETKTGFLNLSDLQDAYATARSLHGWSDKRVSDILASVNNAERAYYILEKQGFIKTGFPAFMEMVKKDGLTKVLKSINCYVTRGRRADKSTSCNPYIWVLIAMEMNPMLYGEVVTWLTDKLILNRIEAGNMYKDLSKAVSKFKDVDYASLSKALNHVVFGRHETGIRNTGTEEQLKELERLENNLAFTIDAGFIKSFTALMEYIREIWTKKYVQQVAA